jgi:hypothetical protein
VVEASDEKDRGIDDEDARNVNEKRPLNPLKAGWRKNAQRLAGRLTPLKKWENKAP